VLFRRKPKGYGHLVVYRFDDKIVEVLHVFHTAQDWQTMLIDDG
jgi:plasmid stabilization system protein ParE